MKKLSTFDLTMIIVFVVVGLAGGGAWFYLSGLLDTAKQDVGAAAQDFDRYSSKEVYLPTSSNLKVLQSDIEVLKAQLDPLLKSKLQPEKSELSSKTSEDTVAWKHDLDAEALSLNALAKLHAVTVPNNFYYSFSRYLSQAPAEEKTAVLSKQLLAVKEIATILINAPVKKIETIRRTYEEDVGSSSAASGAGAKSGADTNILAGNATDAPGGVYTAYPFEIEFDATTDNLRKVVDDLIQSPYVFVIRSLAIQNVKLASPQISDLDKLAATPTGSVGDSSPGTVAADTPDKGPQFLFGDETLRVKARIDLIEWKGAVSGSAPNSDQGKPRGKAPADGDNATPTPATGGN